MSIVQTNIKYNSNLLRQNLLDLKSTYPFINLNVVGYSVLGKSLYSVRLGNGPKKVLYSASIHANEWITSLLLMKFIEDYAIAYQNNLSLYGTPIRDLFNNVSIFIMPMVNPDGVDLVNDALNPNSFGFIQASRIAYSYATIPFPSGWKANINGVDLNLQFPAEWEKAKKIKFDLGFTDPAPRDFVGYGPLTEPEALAIYNLALSNNFDLTIAYHTQGEEIYWNFNNINPPRGLQIAWRFAYASGYVVQDVPYNSSFAGFKDWFIQDFNKPGFTIEAGLGENPLPISQFNDIYRDNLPILILGATLA